VEKRAPFVLKCCTVRRGHLALGAILAGALLLGCDRGPCTSTRSVLRLPDGGPVRCLQPEDCPLTGNILICVDSGEPNHLTQGCVRCVETTCVSDVCVP
jgi:hypothetical protein